MDSLSMLDLVMRDRDFVIYNHDHPLLTQGGNEFSHSNDRLMKHILTDMQFSGSLSRQRFSARRIFEFQKDFLDKGTDLILERFEQIAADDHFIQLKTGASRREEGMEAANKPGDSHEHENSLVSLVFWSISPVVITMNAFISERITSLETEEISEEPIIFLVKQEYLGLPVHAKALFHFLTYIHQADLVLPILLLTGRITASEYTKGLISLRRAWKGTRDQGSPLPDEIPSVLTDEDQDGITILDLYLKFLDEAMAGLDYLRFFTTRQGSTVSIEKMVRSGEGSELEFKSTLRWDLKQGKANPAIEKASLKTMAAFLNSQGGTLLIGVRDDGSIEGIETDKFANEDKFLLHLWTLIRTTMGRDISTYVQISLEKAGSGTVCMISCAKSIRPVFLKMPGFEEEFYIRLGPSSNALNISEALKYIADRFPGK